MTARIERLASASQRAEPARAGPLRFAGPAFLGDLGDQVWFEASRLPGVAALEEAWVDVRNEFDAAADRLLAQPYLEPFDHARLETLATRGQADAEWNAVFLLRHGEPVEPNASLLPRTMAMLRATGQATGETLISVLGPGARTPVHSSGCNVVLTCHLPIRVPDGCGLRVAGQARRWQEGRALAFDDSFVHMAWNDSTEPRLVLVWDIWHPNLTHQETSLLTELLPELLPGS